jgi:hypothetical protein
MLYYFAWFVLIFSVMRIGDNVYGIVNFISRLPQFILGIPPWKHRLYNGICSGLFGTLSLYFLIDWSFTNAFTHYPRLSRFSFLVFALILIIRIYKAPLRIKYLEANYPSGMIDFDSMTIHLSIPSIRSAHRWTIVTFLILVVIEFVMLFQA